jgi:hypothetical protein
MDTPSPWLVPGLGSGQGSGEIDKDSIVVARASRSLLLFLIVCVGAPLTEGGQGAQARAAGRVAAGESARGHGQGEEQRHPEGHAALQRGRLLRPGAVRSPYA